jgi:iron(III) transport system permease protein
VGEQLIGFVPWNIYSMFSIVVIAGLTHVPHAYLYISSALRSVGSDVEEAARTVGASPLQVMTSVSLPMVRPSILYACVLLFFLGWKCWPDAGAGRSGRQHGAGDLSL